MAVASNSGRSSPSCATAIEGSRRRGRPRTTRATEIQKVALELFTDNGYSNTTVEDIAKAVGISKMTFFRYFSSKSSVIWHDYELSNDRLLKALSVADPRTPLLEAVRVAIISSTLNDDWDPKIIHSRDRLVENEPALFPESAATSIRFATTIAQYLRSQADFDLEAAPDAIGYALLGATAGAVRIALLEDGEQLPARLDESLSVMSAAMQAAFKYRLITS